MDSGGLGILSFNTHPPPHQSLCKAQLFPLPVSSSETCGPGFRAPAFNRRGDGGRHGGLGREGKLCMGGSDGDGGDDGDSSETRRQRAAEVMERQ